MNNRKKEYIVTLKKFDDLESFYNQMESKTSSLASIPSRSVQCVLRRPVSRNTYYLLTDEEASLLRNDPRVESVVVRPPTVSRKVNYATREGAWNRGTTATAGQKNWGLYRSSLGENEGTWGSDLGDTERTTPITINGTGKNVDIIVVDEVLYPDHPEFTGRVVEYDWFRQHDVAVRGTDLVLTTVARTSNRATVKTLTPHKLADGAVIDVICTSDNTFSATSTTVLDVLDDNTFQYASTGDNLLETSAEGYWRGVYQYPSYTIGNNHATAMAGIIAGVTQGWATEANIYNLRHDSFGIRAGEYTPNEYLIDYIREFHKTKPVNPETGRKNPTIVNNSWGFGYNIDFLGNIYTGNPNFSKLYYRGSFVEPASEPVDTGISGVCSSVDLIAPFPSVEAGNAYSIVTDEVSASVTPITFEEAGTGSLINLGEPSGSSSGGVDLNDDALWQLSLPFAVNYLGTSYQNNVYLSSNSFISFGGFFNGFPEFSYNFPGINKIYLSAGDRNVRDVWAGTFGTAPNRTHVLRFEGWDGAYSSFYEQDTSLVWEMVFYENTPARIDVRIVKNSAFRGEFTLEEISSYGVLTDGDPVPLRVVDIDADIEDAVNEGIIFVGAAGNSKFKIDTEGGVDFNNYTVDNGLPIYYHKGGSPGNSDPRVICVGSLDSSSLEPKQSKSNTGPGVDLYAPGVNIISSVYDTTGSTGASIDEGNGNLYQKWSGSSVAAAQVTGLLALVLEKYPRLKQADAKEYILNYAKEGKIFDSQGGYSDSNSLQGGNNKIAFYFKERKDEGVLFPKVVQWLRPSSGLTYPRPQIRRK